MQRGLDVYNTIYRMHCTARPTLKAVRIGTINSTPQKRTLDVLLTYGVSRGA